MSISIPKINVQEINFFTLWVDICCASIIEPFIDITNMKNWTKNSDMPYVICILLIPPITSP